MSDSSVRFRYNVTSNDPEVVRCIVAATGFFYPHEVDVAVELVTERLAKGDASGYHFVFAEDDDGVIGYACYGPIACTVGSHDFYWLAVDPARQGRGVGRRLVDETERLIHDMGGRHVYIETSNRPQYHPTRKFYERCGYEVIAVLPDFYDRGDDKMILRKDVSNS
jgi:D-alanine-D-alanine ligase